MSIIGLNGTVAKSLANMLVLGSYLGTGFHPEWIFTGPVFRCKAITPSSFSVTSHN